jgi:alkanesulfonate monooxygenase SsuD/methylene tetrahydromethanopterin reductase-like flavin-dependent oxidoreductase (luciferase family)
VALAEDAVALDGLSGGRFVLGMGAGGGGADLTALGGKALAAVERGARFVEFAEVVDRLLTGVDEGFDGRYFSIPAGRRAGGCVQRPRVPFAVAGSGPRGMGLAARLGQAWVTCPANDLPEEPAVRHVRDEVRRLGAVCAQQGRDPAGLERILLTGYTAERPRASVDRFVELAGRYAEAGITEIVIHHPVPGTRYDSPPGAFERIVADGLAQVRGMDTVTR